MKIIESILTKNPCYTAGKKITVKGLMLHSVGCNQPSASVFIKNWNSASYDRACVHGFIDANTGGIYQTLPWNHRGWHCGGSGNNTHIGVEMCEPACIKYTGGSSFTCSDTATAKACVKRTYDAAVELFAYLCKEYGLNPLTDICSHKEGCAKGIASNHGDPEHLWKGLGMSYTMDTFRAAVKAAMSGGSNAASPSTGTEQMYRVRKSWADADSQTGAYRSLENAKKACCVGYTVYDKDGNAVYSNQAPKAAEPTVDYARSFDKAKAGTYTVSANGGLHLRSGASTSKASLEVMPNGSKVTCYGYYTGEWLYVVAASGKKGFCHSGYLKK